MGTHPIFESDFDCLTEMSESHVRDELRVGIAKGNFNSTKYPNCLKLWLGDNVVVLDKKGDWMRGYKISHPSEIGIFPSCYIHIKKKSRIKIADEALMVAEEWVNIYSKYFLEIAKMPRRGQSDAYRDS